MTILNVVVDKEAYGLPDGFIVSVPEKVLNDAILRAQTISEVRRVQMIFKVKRTIEVGNNYINEHPELVGKCQVWNDLMDDCVILLAYQAVQNGIKIEVISDKKLSETFQSQGPKFCDPKMKPRLNGEE